MRHARLITLIAIILFLTYLWLDARYDCRCDEEQYNIVKPYEGNNYNNQ